MKPLDIIRFRYPEKKSSGAIEWEEHVALVLNPLYSGYTHCLKLSELDQNNIRRVISFLRPDKYGGIVKKDPLLMNLAKKYDKSKVKTPLEFYRLFIIPMLRTLPFSIYRKYVKANMRALQYIKTADVMTKGI